jgi:uncharacterized repeat protein (TIGR01451 family)
MKKLCNCLLYPVSCSLLFALESAATTFTVTNNADSGPGSLRQAILDANATPGTNVIHFNVAGSSSVTITPASPLPDITQPVIIDGTTQPGAGQPPRVTLVGTNAGVGANGLTLLTSNSIVRGLAIKRFNGHGVALIGGGGHVIEGNHLGEGSDNPALLPGNRSGAYLTNSAFNRIGGATEAARNVISRNGVGGVLIEGSGAFGNTIEGNYMGLAANGLARFGNNGGDVVITNAPGNFVGGFGSAGNIMVSSPPVLLAGSGAFGNQVAGNTIGFNATRTAGFGHNQGIRIIDAPSNTIGHHSGMMPNIIGNCIFFGIEIRGVNATNNQIINNYIGTDPDWRDWGIRDDAIVVDDFASGNSIGSGFGNGNTIAFADTGVLIRSGTNNNVQANSIFMNASIGIDLHPRGVTPNDPGDMDTGANQQQNFPIITSATNFGSSAWVSGTLNSRPNRSFAIDVYSSERCRNTARDGQKWLGTVTLNTGGGGNGSFSGNFPVPPHGRFITATATDPFGNTSEFSACFEAAVTGSAQTFVVTNSADTGPGSLRRAIIQANGRSATNANTIQFDIPGAGPHLIAPTTPLPQITDHVVIDGFTQPGAAANTLSEGNNAVWLVRLDGANLPSSSHGLDIVADNCIVRGLNLTRFDGSAVRIFGASNRVEGNLIGLSTAGTVLNNRRGVWVLAGSGVTAPNTGGNVIGGTNAAARNVISGNTTGIEVGSSNVVAGNFIGTDVTGQFARGNGDGVRPRGTNILVGGTSPAARNVISGNGFGIVAYYFHQSAFQGNYIGLAADGLSPLGNSNVAIAFSFSTNSVVGGSAAAANVIVHNGGAGVRVGDDSRRIAVRYNSIHSNGQLGIDLGPPGVTPNDPQDADTGPNELQNFPILTFASNSFTSLTISGTLHSTPSSQFLIDLYANDVCDPSGHGEGQTWIGSLTRTTDSNGDNSFTTVLGTSRPGAVITATATDSQGNTSEFSPCIQSVGNQTFLVTNTLNSGSGSLRQAILNANANPPMDAIHFDIPGAGPHVIAPVTPLPAITNRVVLDASTQSGYAGAPLIFLDGTATAGMADGLRLLTTNSTIRGLAIGRFSGNGIRIADGEGNFIFGNWLGLTPAGERAGNGGAGILISNSFNNVIGGDGEALPNVIAWNGHGVAVESGIRNEIGCNSIYRNAGLGIDLGVDGVTPNDPGDLDSGPNNLLNFPIITNVISSDIAIAVSGYVDGAPGQSYRVRFFLNDHCDPSGHGEGKLCAGEAMVGKDEDSSGLATFHAVLRTGLPGVFITATATDSAGNTSEFSPCVALPLELTTLEIYKIDSHDPVVSGSNLTYTVLLTNAGPLKATGVTIVDHLPPGVLFLSATASDGQPLHADGVVFVETPDLLSDTSSTLTIHATVTGTNTLTNTAAVISANRDTGSGSGSVIEITEVIVDSDGDGLPDWYELAHGLDPFDPADALLDLDGDGMKTLYEFWAGTDPLNSFDRLSITSVVHQVTNVLVTFLSVSGRDYGVQRDTNFPSSVWRSFAEVAATTPATTVTDADVSNLPLIAYRVALNRFDYCIADDVSGASLALDSRTGAYRYRRANGDIFTGVGVVTETPLVLSLNDATGHLLDVHIARAQRTAHAVFQEHTGAPSESIVDSDTRTSSCAP